MHFLTLKLVVFIVYLPVYVGNALLNFKASILLFIYLCMLVMYFLSLKLVVFVVYLSLYVGNALFNFKASSFYCLSICVCW